MSIKANKTVIGMFVVGGAALIVLAIVLLGSGRFFREHPTYVMFFEGSVNGLKVGAPVLFRGVPVGTVSEITMEVNPRDLSVLIPVYIEVGDTKIRTMAPQVPPGGVKSQQEIVAQMIKRGLRARLEMQSVVTGLLQVSLDLYPDTPAKTVGADPRYIEIPTIQTPFQMLAEKVQKIPLEEILNRVNLAVDGIQKLVNSPQLQKMASSIQQAADNTRTLIGHIDSQIDPVAKGLGNTAARFEQLAGALEREIGPLTSSLRNTSDQTAQVMARAGMAFSRVHDLTAEDSTIVYRLNKTLEELELTARSLRTLTDTIEQNPRALLFGKQRIERKR